jgi:putative glutamine amidotransferase
MTPPIIGITTDRKDSGLPLPHIIVNEAYVRAVQFAGGIPLLLPVCLAESDLAVVCKKLDGLLLTGGGDINPLRFDGQEHTRVYGVDDGRDMVELGLVHLAVETGLPFLGICRGLQVVNVAMGGTLFTHIDDQLEDALKHDYYPDYPRNLLSHPVHIQAGSRLAKILNGKMQMVNSLHHQGVERAAGGLAATAHAPDGLVEALEVPDHPFGLAVQWHPEWLQEHEAMRSLFGALVEAAGRRN